MRSVFDQYEQIENRVTHALICTLDRDRSLVSSFLEWLGINDAPCASGISIIQQCLPEETPLEECADQRQTRPDACFFDENGWVVALESKVDSGLSENQLIGHWQTLVTRGARNPWIVLITAEPIRPWSHERYVHKRWSEVYAWMAQRSRNSSWATEFVRFLESLESRELAAGRLHQGALTMFHGIPFSDDHPYTGHEAKRLLSFMRDALVKDSRLVRLGVGLDNDGRGAQRGADNYVWDILRIGAGSDVDFTTVPHLTPSIHKTYTGVAITLPNAMKPNFRTVLGSFSFEQFCDMLIVTHRRLQSVMDTVPHSRSRLHLIQRHSPTGRPGSKLVEDAKIDVDLQTLFEGGRAEVKRHPEWARAAWAILREPRSKSVNMQMQVRCEIEHHNDLMRTPKALDVVASAFASMEPVIHAVRSNGQAASGEVVIA